MIVALLTLQILLRHTFNVLSSSISISDNNVGESENDKVEELKKKYKTCKENNLCSKTNKNENNTDIIHTRIYFAKVFIGDGNSKDMRAVKNNYQVAAVRSGSAASNEAANITWNVIDFETNDKSHHCYSANYKHLKVVGSAGSHDHGSSKVKLKNIVDYKWEVKNYPGHLIAVHMDGKHIAYAIMVNNKKEGMVRVLDSETGGRTLIKGMSGEVLDLQFAYIEKERILGCIDTNSLFVHKIDMIDKTLVSRLLIKVEDPIMDYQPKHDKIAWCPFVEGTPDEDADEYDDDSHLLVWSRGSTYQCLNVKQIIAANGCGAFKAKSLQTGYQRFHDPSMTLTWVTISPDASTLAAGCNNGVINFYQVYLHSKDPRCLHHWTPHKNKPISSIFFLDDLTKKKNKYWKFAVTGAVNNTEIKIWDCDSWACLQTLHFGITNDTFTKPHFIAEIDQTSRYLVLSCLETRNCYVMQVGNDEEMSFDRGECTKSSLSNSNNSLTDSSQSGNGVVRIKTIAEFPLSSVVLSFSIVNAAVRRYKCGNESYLIDEMDDYDDETNTVCCVVVHMYLVQSKSMQECRILYQPAVSSRDEVKSSISSFSSSIGSIGGDLNNAKDLIATSDLDKNQGNNSMNGGVICTVLKQSPNGRTSNNEEDELDEENGVHDGVNANANNGDDEKLSSERNNVHENSDGESDDDNKVTVREVNMLEALLNIGASKSNNTSRSNSSIANTMKDENKKTDSSPQQQTSANNKPYSQVNLMTPDAFASAAGSSSNSSETHPHDGVSSEVMNTILMLAGAAGPGTVPPSNTPTLVNKILERKSDQQNESTDNHNEKNDNPPSGASSPSREVREIMSLTESYSGDELLGAPRQESKDVNKIVGTVAPATVTNMNANNVTTTVPWPRAPESVQPSQQPAAGMYSDELRNAAQIISQAVQANSPNNMPPTFGSIAPASAATAIAASTHSNASNELVVLNRKMDTLIDLVTEQSKKINTMQAEICELKKTKDKSPQKNVGEISYKLEMSLSKLLEQYLQRFENEHNKKFAIFTTGRDTQTREIREYFIQVVNQFLLTQVGDMISKAVAIESNRQLAPLFASKLDHLHQQIQVDLAQKMTTINHMLQDSVAHVCSNKNVIDTFGKSVCAGIQNSMQNVFVDSMMTTLVPAYERSSQNMFKELSDTFGKGLQEFVLQLDKYVENLKPMHKSNEDILKTLEAVRYYIDVTANTLQKSVAEIQQEVLKEIKSMEILMLHQIQETVRNEVRKSLDSSAMAAMRSQANTPAPALYDAKESIKQMLLQGQINKAFHQALLANDLNLVEFTLKSVDHNDVFTPECCLEQKVLLSLIQQISADMSRHNDSKQNYLIEALLAINLNDPISREHAPKVLHELSRNCQMFLINHPKSTFSSNVRMLIKAVQSFNLSF